MKIFFTLFLTFFIVSSAYAYSPNGTSNGIEPVLLFRPVDLDSNWLGAVSSSDVLEGKKQATEILKQDCVGELSEAVSVGKIHDGNTLMVAAICYKGNPARIPKLIKGEFTVRDQGLNELSSAQAAINLSTAMNVVKAKCEANHGSPNLELVKYNYDPINEFSPTYELDEHGTFVVGCIFP